MTLFNKNRPLEWTCHICGEWRSDKLISVAVHDVSSDFDMPEGTMTCNVRYCNDRKDCEEKAKDESYPHHGQREEFKQQKRGNT